MLFLNISYLLKANTTYRKTFKFKRNLRQVMKRPSFTSNAILNLFRILNALNFQTPFWQHRKLDIVEWRWYYSQNKSHTLGVYHIKKPTVRGGQSALQRVSPLG